MHKFDLDRQFVLIYNGGERWFGLSREDVLERTGRAAFLLNIMGFIDNEEVLSSVHRRVFLDIDPGFGQMWQDLGLHDPFIGYDAYVTIGENIGRPGCAIPTCGLEWITTPQPVVLDYWEPQPVTNNGLFTSIGSWRGSYGPLEYKGKSYGLRVHEFRKFVPLPHLSSRRFQMALDIHPSETRDIELLRSNGWSLVDPNIIGADPWMYRNYVQTSRAEFMVAKNMYVRSNSGWFSDRSITYLASGRPVLAQDTGIKDLYPIGEGLLTFATLEEAVSGVEELEHNYARHTRAARAIATEFFDSDKVLPNLLSKLGVA